MTMQNLIAQAPAPIVDPGGAAPGLFQLNNLYTNVLAAVLSLAAIVLFVFVVMSGYKYITSAGDPTKAADARNTLTYAVYGVFFIAIAFLIILLIATITGASSLRFFSIFVP